MPEVDLVEALDPAFLSGLGQVDIVLLRAKRERCAELETGLSYLRRLAQARIDLITAELGRRERGLPPAGPEVLVAELPHILGEHARPEGPGRIPAFLAPAEVAQSSLAARVDAICPGEQLGALGELTTAALSELLARLSALESEVSAERKELHGVQDKIEEELVRRYRSGEATVDALLT